MTLDEVKEMFKESIDTTDTMNQAIEKLIQSIYLKGYNDALKFCKGDEAYSFPEVFGEPIEMLIDGVWVRGKVIDGYRSRDGIVNMESEDGKKYYCSCERTEYYRKPKEVIKNE